MEPLDCRSDWRPCGDTTLHVNVVPFFDIRHLQTSSICDVNHWHVCNQNKTSVRFNLKTFLEKKLIQFLSPKLEPVLIFA